MSDGHKQTLQKANQAIKRGDFEGFLVHCTEDTRWTFVGEQELRGKDAVRQWMRETYKEPPRFEVHRLIAEGDFLVAMGEITLTDEQGSKTSSQYCDVWRFEGGKLAELRAFVREASAAVADD
jgi:ketosteroid isomerase-like protein